MTQDQESKGAADLEEEVDSSSHPLLINQYPLGMNHAILLLFAKEGLPQVLSDEILTLLFPLFRMSQNKHLRIGYNSMGAECWVNNLHFHVLLADKMFQDIQGIDKFPIEYCGLKKFMSSDLQHKNESEINMFSYGVEVSLVEDWPIHTFVVKPSALIEKK